MLIVLVLSVFAGSKNSGGGLLHDTMTRSSLRPVEGQAPLDFLYDSIYAGVVFSDPYPSSCISLSARSTRVAPMASPLAIEDGLDSERAAVA